MKYNYKLWLWLVKTTIIPLIKLKTNIYLPLYIPPSKILYLPKHVPPKLILQSLNSLYTIIIKDVLQYIEAKTNEYLYIRIGFAIRFYLLYILDELFQIVLPKTSTKLLNIIIYISYTCRTFENGRHKITLFKDEHQDLNEIIQSLLNNIYKLDEKYNIIYIHTIRIKIIYEK